MTPGIRPLIAGNWKMNGLKDAGSLLKEVIAGYDVELADRADIKICPPATLVLAFAAMAADSKISIGGQDCHPEPAGAHTGDISAEMLADAGAISVIVGHSERRHNHGERDELVRRKAEAAWRAGLIPIVCVGETEAERQAGATLQRVGDQLANSLPQALDSDLVIAYEPVWAIGTGITPTPEDAGEVHAFIRHWLNERFGEAGRAIRILYGGSVKPDNAQELLAVDNVDGGLVGGASLNSADFLGIASACLHMER